MTRAWTPLAAPDYLCVCLPFPIKSAVVPNGNWGSLLTQSLPRDLLGGGHSVESPEMGLEPVFEKKWQIEQPCVSPGRGC